MFSANRSCWESKSQTHFYQRTPWSLFIDFLLLAAHLVDAFNFGMIFVCSGPVNGQKAFPSWLLLVIDERQQLIDADVVAAKKKSVGDRVILGLAFSNKETLEISKCRYMPICTESNLKAMNKKPSLKRSDGC